MKGMILAAGRGSRMRELTNNLPKPLLSVGGKTLIEYRVETLVSMGIRNVVINLHYCADKITALLGDGSAYGASIRYSYEETPLDVGGGIYHALPLLGDASFITMNADVWTDYTPGILEMPAGSLAHLVFVRNPGHNLSGDFGLVDGRVVGIAKRRYTFSGIAFYHPDFFSICSMGAFSLKSVLDKRIAEGLVTGELYEGGWYDVGTPERLAVVRNSCVEPLAEIAFMKESVFE